MTEILEYITANYTWIIGGTIIILLAIIGRYADKTNFGQGKKKNSETTNKVEPPKEEIKKETDENVETNGEDVKEENILDDSVNELKDTYKNEETKVEDDINPSNEEPKFNSFDEEFNQIIPEKEVIDGDLLDEIENLSLDKTQKVSVNDIPDLDNLELPKIKDFKSNDDDIWKF